MAAPYQNGVAVRAHGRPEPLVGLEINLNVRVVQQDGAIPWKKSKQQKHPSAGARASTSPLPLTPEYPRACMHASASQARGNIWTIGRTRRTPVTPFFIQRDNQGAKKFLLRGR